MRKYRNYHGPLVDPEGEEKALEILQQIETITTRMQQNLEELKTVIGAEETKRLIPDQPELGWFEQQLPKIDREVC